MSSSHTFVCIKQVTQDSADQWQETFPLPGDIIEGIAEDHFDDFISAKARSELSLHLGKINQINEYVWLKVRRGENTVFQKRFTIRAADDKRHVAVLADLTFEECFELHERSKNLVNLNFKGYHRKGIRYDWKHKIGSFLPDTIVSSILFMPLTKENVTEASTVRAMTWFSLAVSSGIPLVFVSTQTEQIIISVNGKELAWSGQNDINTTINIVQGIRLWFLPGVQEIHLELSPELGEARFGIDIKRNEEGFMCITSITKGTSADRAGLGRYFKQATSAGHLLVISRLQGKSLMPSIVDSGGLIHCCDNANITFTLLSAMENTEDIQLHMMSWPNQSRDASKPESVVATLMPPHHVLA